jgi:hypothetical protein
MAGGIIKLKMTRKEAVAGAKKDPGNSRVETD